MQAYSNDGVSTLADSFTYDKVIDVFNMTALSTKLVYLTANISLGIAVFIFFYLVS